MLKQLLFVFRFAGAYFRRSRFVPKAVPYLIIETTNFCDARCVICANVLMKRPREHLDMAIFKKVVDEFIAWGGSVIAFNTTIGEPLLDPYLLERARYVKKFPQVYSLGFITNLQWLHKLDMDEFFNSGINWLGISTVLSGRDKYLEFFGVDRYEQVKRNIVVIIEENKKRGKRINITFAVKPTNEGVNAAIKHPDFRMISSLANIDLATQLKRHDIYVDDWIGKVKIPSYLKKRPLYPRAFRPCALLYTGITLFSNSSIGACPCRDFEADSELILGNAGKAGLKELWASGKLAHIRRDWRRNNKIPDICRRCSHYVY